jgi:hypothetical protein
MYKVYFYVPESHLEIVKAAIFAEGAGKYGNYDSWSWQTKGKGQFRALAGSHPAIGKLNQLSHVLEYKVETICEDDQLNNVLKALLKAHPYEQPAYGFSKIAMNGETSLV